MWNRVVDGQAGEDFCKNLGFDGVHLICPASNPENHILWQLHPVNPMAWRQQSSEQTHREIGILTGIKRTINMSNEDYWCDASLTTDCPLFQQRFFAWDRDKGEPSFLTETSYAWWKNPFEPQLDEDMWTNTYLVEHRVWIMADNSQWGDTDWEKQIPRLHRQAVIQGRRSYFTRLSILDYLLISSTLCVLYL